MNEETKASERVPMRVALLATAIAAAWLGWGRAMSAASGWDSPSWGNTMIEIVDMLGIQAISLIGFRAMSGRFPSLADLGIAGADLASIRASSPHLRRGPAICLGVVALAGIAAVLAVAGPDMSPALLLTNVLVRWPIAVLAQQTLFFGWLQPRVGDHGLRKAALLYAAMHVINPSILIFVIPLGFLFATERQRTGSIRAGLVTHYLIDVAVLILVGSL